MNNHFTILIVEDNPGDLRLLQELLRESKIIDVETLVGTTLQQSIDILTKKHVDIILLDLNLPDSHGLATFNSINNIIHDIPIMILSGLNDEELATSAIKQGAQDYFVKGSFDNQLLARAILYAIERKKAENTLKEYELIVESSSDAIFSVSLEGKITHWNKGAEYLFKYTSDEVNNDNVDILLPTESKELVNQLLKRIKSGNVVAQYETKLISKTKEMYDVLLSAAPMRSQTGTITGASLIVRDISQRKFAEQVLAIEFRVAISLAESINLDNAAHNILKTICEVLDWQMGEIWAVDQSNNVLRFVSNWHAINIPTEISEINERTIFKPGEEVPGIVWEKKSFLYIHDISESNIVTRTAFINKLHFKSCIGFPILFNNEVLGIVVFFSKQIHEINNALSIMFENIGSQLGSYIKRKRVEGDLLYLAHHDALTGLANRVVAEDSLNAAISKAKQYHKKVGLLYMDLDHFKLINDTIGHDKGDQVLCEVATRLRQATRQTDLVARFGGDEFLMILPDLSDKESIVIIARKVLQTISKPIVVDNVKHFLSASIGISIYPDDGDYFTKLFKAADIAMYSAKEAGRNNYKYYSAQLDPLLENKLKLADDLHEAIRAREFVLYYQPIIDVATNTVVSFEALIRWDRFKSGKLVPPSEFIPLLEETKLIVSVGEWLLKEVCGQINQWQVIDSKSIAVNISIHQLDFEFIEHVKKILKDYKINAKNLVFEITESSLMREPDNGIKIIDALNELGIRISIDDFGIEYSSLSYIKNFKIASLKIDKSFVSTLSSQYNSRAIVIAIIAMAHSLDIKTIAEGVETKDELDFLRENHCDQYQGFYFSKPLPASEVIKFLDQIDTKNQ